MMSSWLMCSRGESENREEHRQLENEATLGIKAIELDDVGGMDEGRRG